MAGFAAEPLRWVPAGSSGTPSTPSLELMARLTGATEHTRPIRLSDINSQVVLLSGHMDLIVRHTDIRTYRGQGRRGEETKVTIRVLLQSDIAEEYCYGIFLRRGEDDLQAILHHWKSGNAWRFERIHLAAVLDGCKVSTGCNFTIDLDQSVASPSLQNITFPCTPVPTLTIAELSTSETIERVDVMAIPKTVTWHRPIDNGLHMLEVVLVDGSRENCNQATEHALLPLSIVIYDASDYIELRNYVGKTPVNFMCLAVSRHDGQLKATTIKDETWMHKARGAKALTMAANAAALCGGDGTSRESMTRPTKRSRRNEDGDTGFVIAPWNEDLEQLLQEDLDQFTVSLKSRAMPQHGEASPVYAMRKAVPHVYANPQVFHLAGSVNLCGQIYYDVHENEKVVSLLAETELGVMEIACTCSLPPILPDLGDAEHATEQTTMWVHKMTIELSSNTERECAICYDAVSRNGDDVVVLPCTHVYHKNCYATYMRRGKRTCPQCKKPSHLVCSCTLCDINWLLEGWKCPTQVVEGRCDIKFENGTCPGIHGIPGCGTQHNDLCPLIRNYYRCGVYEPPQPGT